MKIRRLNTFSIGASPFMLRSHLQGAFRSNMINALGGGQWVYHNSTVAARSNKDGALDKAQLAGGFDDWFAGTPEQIRDHMLTGDYDVVRICTPDNDHAFYANAALAAGKVVLCEKGLAHELPEARTMVDAAAQATEGVGFVQYSYNGLDAVRLLRDLISQGRIMDLNSGAYGVKLDFAQDWGIDDRSNWRFDPKRAGRTGVLGDLGTHSIRNGLYVTEARNDEVVAVEGHTQYYAGFGKELRLLSADEVDTDNLAVDAASYTLIMKSGATMTGSTGRHFRFSKADMTIEVSGVPGGKASWHLLDPCFVNFTEHTGVSGSERGSKRIHCGDFVPGLSAGFESGHGNLDLDVLRWLEGGRQGAAPGTSFAQAYHCLQIAEAIRLAGIRHTRVQMSEIE